MKSKCYRLIPNKDRFLSFMKTIELSPEQQHCLDRLVLDHVEIDCSANTWKVAFDAVTNPLEEQNLAAVGAKLAAACAVARVSFSNEHAEPFYPPWEEDRPLPELPPDEDVPEAQEECGDDGDDDVSSSENEVFQSRAYQDALRALRGETAGPK